ncbi:MAG: hypothetical protein JWM19_2502 [Actinomycetia bacterium]|nr:hypothetical protein [Actinomycetes bacterium]
MCIRGGQALACSLGAGLLLGRQLVGRCRRRGTRGQGPARRITAQLLDGRDSLAALADGFLGRAELDGRFLVGCSGGEQRVLRLAASIAAGQAWLTDGTIAERARLLTRLDNFLRTSPAVMNAFTAFMAEDTGLPNPATPS